MKKRGYTLAELLITIGIIAIIAAIVLPLINKFKPDSNKILYLKTYDAIVEVVGNMVSNQEFYPTSDGTYSYAKAPLYNLQEVTVAGTKYGGSAKKFCELLGLSLSSTGAASCSDTYQEYSDNLFDSPSFVSANGVQFVVTTNVEGYYRSDIYFDVNGSKGGNCMYGESCKNPDRFKVSIAADGTIAADNAGQGHLNKRSNWKKAGYTPATTIASLPLDLFPKEVKEYKEPEVKEPDGPETPNVPDTPQITLVGMPCLSEYSWARCKGSYLEVQDIDQDTKMNWQDATDACADLGLRLPTLSELYTIHEAVINGKLNGTTVTEYWTSSGYSQDAGMAQNGIVGGSYWAKGVENKSTKRQVRCVQ